MEKELIGIDKFEFTPEGIANFLEGKIIESENYKGFFTNVYSNGFKSNTFEFDLVVAKKGVELIKSYESLNEQGKPIFNRINVLSSGKHHITIRKSNLEDTCKVFVDIIEKVGLKQEELNSKLYKQFTMGTM